MQRFLLKAYKWAHKELHEVSSPLQETEEERTEEEEEWNCPSMPFPWNIWESPENSLSEAVLRMCAPLSQQPPSSLSPYPTPTWAILEGTPCDLARRGHGEWAITEKENFLFPIRSITRAWTQPHGAKPGETGNDRSRRDQGSTLKQYHHQEGCNGERSCPLGKLPSLFLPSKRKAGRCKRFFFLFLFFIFFLNPAWATNSEPKPSNLARPKYAHEGYTHYSINT